MKEISDLITNLGYPIVMSLILLYMMNANEKKCDETVEALRQTINDNTQTLIKLCDALDFREGKENGKKE